MTGKDGTPLDTLPNIKLRLARRSQQTAWIGFILMTAGFLVELVEALVGGG